MPDDPLTPGSARLLAPRRKLQLELPAATQMFASQLPPPPDDATPPVWWPAAAADQAPEPLALSNAAPASKGAEPGQALAETVGDQPAGPGTDVTPIAAADASPQALTPPPPEDPRPIAAAPHFSPPAAQPDPAPSAPPASISLAAATAPASNPPAPLAAARFVAAADEPVAQAQITELAKDLKSFLDKIETTLTNKVFLQDLPIIGSQLGAAFAANLPAVTAFQSFEQAVLNALTGFSAGSTTAQLQTAINQAIAALKLPGDPGSVTVTNPGGTLTVAFGDTFTPAAFSTSLDGSFGLPGLGFKTAGAAQASLSYGFSATATVTQGDAFAIAAPNGALSLTLNVSAPAFSADATLGVINSHALDRGSNLSGTFTLDTSGNAVFQGSAALHVGLASDLGSAVLPSIGTQLDAGWSFTASNGQVDPSNQAGFGAQPTVALSNVTYDFGSFLDNFLAPLMTSLNQAIDPIRPALDVLDADIPLLRDALGDHWHALDTSGALDAEGHNAPDGKLSLLDFLNEPTGDPGATPAIVQLVDTLNTISNFAQQFGGRTGSPDTPFDLGSFNIPADVRNAALQIGNVVPQLVGGSSESLKSFEAGLSTIYPNVDPGTGDTEGQDISNLLTNAQLSFPLLQNPVLAASVLLGAKADLFTLNEPEQFIGVGSFNADGSIASAQTILALPIAVPPIPISVTPGAECRAGRHHRATPGLRHHGAAGLRAGRVQGPLVDRQRALH